MPRLPFHFSAAIPLACLLIASCANAPKPALMAQTKDVDVSVAELRAQDYDFASLFGENVARCADQIMFASSDPEIRDRALLWKIYAVPAARSAAFHHDPLAALYDLWALTVQQRNYFKTGDGADAFGDQQACAIEVSTQLNEDAVQLARSITKSHDVSEVEKRVEKWAKENPVQGELFTRRSTSAVVAAIAPQGSKTGLQAVGSLEELTRDLADRITIMSEDLPNETRWQAEYLVNALFEEHLEEPTELASDFFGRANTTMQDFPALLSGELDEFLEAVRAERADVFDRLSSVSSNFLKTADEQREIVLASLEERENSAFTKLEKAGEDLIDYFFLRALQFLGVIVVLILIGYWFFMRRTS